MRRTPVLATLAAASVTLLALSGTTAHAATGTPAAGAGAAVVHDAATGADQQAAVLEHWTPERMRSAVPIEQLAGDVLSSLPTGGEPTVGTPTVVDPTPATTAPADVTPAAFPHLGGAWTGGGAVTQTVGRVFFDFQGQASSCSGNAVTSANGSVVTTAGHCIKLEGSFHTNWVFVPGYDNGNDPFGTWAAAQTFITPQWDSSENINYDIGAVVVSPLGGDVLTDVVGGQGIAFNQSRGLDMYAFGYPAASPYDGSELIYCSGGTFNDPLFSTAIGMDCDMTGGSSGGPWFFDFDEGTGTGVQNSVNSFGYIFFPDVMFGPYYGSEGEAVYNAAQSA